MQVSESQVPKESGIHPIAWCTWRGWVVGSSPATRIEPASGMDPRSRADLRVLLRDLASGLPVGSDLEYADEVTLGRAFEGRRRVDDD